MDIPVTRHPTVVRQGVTDGVPFGSSGRARLKVNSRPVGEGGYALVEGAHPTGEPRIRDHVHARHDETFVVLEGSYRVRIGKEIVVVAAGDYVFVPRGTPHTYQNEGLAPSRMLVILGPADAVDLLAELGNLAGGEIDEESLAALHARHAATLVDPLPTW